MVKKPCLKVQILQCKILDWKWPTPPSELFENSSDLEMRGIPYRDLGAFEDLSVVPPTMLQGSIPFFLSNILPIRFPNSVGSQDGWEHDYEYVHTLQV